MSRHQKETAPVIVKHRHCMICSTPIPMSKEFCSTACEDEHKRIARRRKYSLIATVAMFPVLLILLTLLRTR